jgi:hypothetical protein
MLRLTAICWFLAVFSASLSAALLRTSQAASQPAAQAGKPAALALAEAPEEERHTIDRLLGGASWARRAVGVLRLERYGCQPSRDLLAKAMTDAAWQVRSFALRALIRRGEVVDPVILENEHEPRVIRAALRYRVMLDAARIGRGVRVLARSDVLADKMLAVELASASGDAELLDLARDTAKQVILKMDRAEAGVLSARLAAVTGQRKLRRHYEWKNWLLKTGRRFTVGPAFALPEAAGPQPPSLIAQLESDQFVGVESYMQTLGQRELDLAILLDCTASMWGEISAAQAGIDDLMRFVGDIVSSARIAIVAFRDRRDEFETTAWDFTADVSEARAHLWTLTADGGGDFPEAVFPAMKLAFTQLTWRPESTKVVVLVGDAPPHIGFGEQTADLAGRARKDAEVTTHAIQAEGKDVKHFPEIAKAGGGRCVSLEDDDALVAEIAGLTLADRYEQEFREFFQVYLELCR